MSAIRHHPPGGASSFVGERRRCGCAPAVAGLRRPGDGPGTLHLHRESSRAYRDQVTAEHYVYRKPKKGRGRGKWSWEPKAEGRPNHYGDTLFGVYAIADMKNCRTLPAREVLAARRSALAGQPKPAGAGGVRTPDGLSFLAVNRR